MEKRACGGQALSYISTHIVHAGGLGIVVRNFIDTVVCYIFYHTFQIDSDCA